MQQLSRRRRRRRSTGPASSASRPAVFDCGNSASIPSRFSRDQETWPLRRRRAAMFGFRALPAKSDRSCSRLRECLAIGSMPAAQHVSTSRCCASASSCEMSRNVENDIASSTSSNVARNAATSCVGRLEITRRCPTASPCRRAQAQRAQGRIERCKQHVGGLHFGAVRRLNSVDFRRWCSRPAPRPIRHPLPPARCSRRVAEPSYFVLESRDALTDQRDPLQSGFAGPP